MSRTKSTFSATWIAIAALSGAVSSFAASARADFNKDGYEDLAIGSPYENANGATNSGAVYVIYGSPNGLDLNSPDVQRWYQSNIGTPGGSEADDLFGSALAAGDFNHDGYDDLAIGSPGEDFTDSMGSYADAGAVTIIYGSNQGLTVTAAAPSFISWLPLRGTVIGSVKYLNRVKLCNCPNAGALDVAHARLGSSLAVGDLNMDNLDDLAIGSPDADIREDGTTYVYAGAVLVLYGAESIVPLIESRSSIAWDLNPQSHSNYGFALAVGSFRYSSYDALAIGVPYRSVTFLNNSGLMQTVQGAGAVEVLEACEHEIRKCFRTWITQATPGVDSSPEPSDLFGYSLAAGDFDGNGVDDLVVGVPFENAGDLVNAGSVQIFPGSFQGLLMSSSKLWTQSTVFGSSPDIFEGSPSEAGDRFGFSLAVGDFNGDGREDLAIGVPYEDVVVDQNGQLTQVNDAGEIDVVYGSQYGLSVTARAPQMWHQSTINIEDTAEAGDLFGFALTSGNFGGLGSNDDLAIGVPIEKIGTIQAGAVNVIYGSPTNNGLGSSGDQFWHKDVANFPGSNSSQDNFGRGLR